MGNCFYCGLLLGRTGSSGTSNSSTLIFGSIIMDPSLTVLELTTEVFKIIFEGSMSFIEWRTNEIARIKSSSMSEDEKRAALK